jgi:predicted AlkP superfamily phosphohydrolase/phosphomutase
MTTRPRVAVIGLDAADPGLLRHWAAAGKLPTIARLLVDGTCMPVRNPPGLYVGAVWPTLFTGVPPTRHRRYCYEQIIGGSYQTRAFGVGDYGAEPFWNELARRGLKVAIVDVPKSPTTTLPGTFVWDWGTHDPEPAGFHCSPEDLNATLQTRFGTDPVGVCDHYQGTAESLRALQERLLVRIEKKTSLLLELARKPEWDLFFGVFSESHCAGHQYWSLHDAADHLHDAAVARMLGDPIETVYRAMDHALGRVVAALPPETVVFVVASHGMDSHYDANFLLPDMIALMHTSRVRADSVGLMQRVWHRLPARLRAAIRPPLVTAGQWLSRRRAGAPPGLGSALRSPAPSRLRYFAVPNNDAHGAVRINLAGREPEGCVQPADLEDAIDDLREGLMGFINEDTGRPVVEAIHRIGDLYPGEPVTDLPDLIIDWDRSAPITRLRSSKYGRVDRRQASRRTGDHRPTGLLVARGGGYAPGAEQAEVASTALAATVSALLGVDRTDLPGPVIPRSWT